MLSISLAGVAVCTWVSFRLGLGLATVGFLYLTIVLLTAIHRGFWAATSVSLAAVTCLNYFFVDPIFTFRVNSFEDCAALCAFELTALVVSRLSQISKQRAAEALAERRESERLYQTARRILLFGASGEPAGQLTSVIREIFQLDAVILFDSVTVSTHTSGAAPKGAEESTRSAYLVDRNHFDPNTRSWFCALHLDARPMGGLALCGGAISSLAASALGSLCATALERARSIERECHLEAARESEQLRAAVLDALGHEFKTPLTTIWTASSGLLELGGLSGLQYELVTVIDEQSQKLHDLSSRLLTTAKLDRGDFEPRCTAVLGSNLVRSVIGSLGSGEARERIRLAGCSREKPAWADSKLLTAALTQLLDNAIKYSTPGSPIEIGFDSSGERAIISVCSHGTVIPPSERERIFERFCRAHATADGPAGTGLGLSIVKRIAEAHQGRVWVESESARGTVFFLSLPVAREGLARDGMADDEQHSDLAAGVNRLGSHARLSRKTSDHRRRARS
ncbi:MAG TPA: ATP-binding protein [Bryobacteraceae bacterium]|nr:ATP-binding protein [Bryobacteraceae bacterium]